METRGFQQTKDEYLDWLKLQIEHDLDCPAYFLRSETVREEIEGNTIWFGDVEVFGLIGHSQAKRCFAWGHEYDHSDPNGRAIVTLEVPPIVSVQTAVRAQLTKDMREAGADPFVENCLHSYCVL